MTTFAGRCEALITVPTGGAAVSASTGGQTANATVTVPAADYFLSNAGGLPGLCATLQQQLNDNVQGYPTSAALMAAAVGYGTWSAGYLLNESSGNLIPAFGSPNLVPSGSPVYGVAGPRGGIDKAIGYSTTADVFTGGTTDFDVTATDDIIIAWVAKVASAPAGTDVIGKGISGAARWYLWHGTGGFAFNVNDGTNNIEPATASLGVGEWHVGIAVLERAAAQVRVGIRTLSGTTTMSSATSAAGLGSLSNAVAVKFGKSIGNADLFTNYAALYIAKGNGAATGLVTNLSTALANFAAAVSAAWSVSNSTTTGLTTIGYSAPPAGVPSFALDWTNTTLRDLLGFSMDLDYPTTAANLASQIGFGNWTSGAGWLCNEASGSLAAVFGSPALAAVSTPLYGFVGPRGGADKAVGFDSVSDSFSGGDVFDVTATSDLILSWVGKFTAAPAGFRAMFAKLNASAVGYRLYTDTGMGMNWQCRDGTVNPLVSFGGPTVGEWHVGIAVLERATNTIRVGTRTFSGATSISANTATGALGDCSNAANFLLGGDGGVAFQAPETFQCAAYYVATGVGVATGLSANLSTALANFANSFGAWTSTKQARGLWLPDCPIFIADSDPRLAPVGSDARSSVSPSGEQLTLVGNWWREHRSVRWERVPVAQIREAAALYPNASWRQFWDDTQLGRGLSWFAPGSNLLIIDDTGQVVGSDMQATGPTRGWAVNNPGQVQARRADPGGWSGHWMIEFPVIVAKDS